MILKDYSELAEIREKNKDKIIVFCSGVFDLFHAGHIIFFEDCKKEGDILIVGIGNDLTIKKYKGMERPIMNEKIRRKSVDSLKVVDYCIIDNDRKDHNLKNKFLNPLIPIFENLRPNKWVINEDSFDIFGRKELADRYGIELITLKRWCPEEFERISTTKLIEKIKKLT